MHETLSFDNAMLDVKYIAFFAKGRAFPLGGGHFTNGPLTVSIRKCPSGHHLRLKILRFRRHSYIRDVM